MFEVSDCNEGKVAVIKMVHGKVNAMDLEFCLALPEQLKRLKDSDYRAVVLTGNERVFSAGVDLVRLINEDVDYLDEFLPALTGCFEAVFEFAKPIVAAINGHAIAGGCIIASACDIRLIHDRARIGLPELRIGVPLPSLAVEIMRFVSSKRAFLEMVTMGKSYRGQHAVDVGLADRLVEKDDLINESVSAATELTVLSETVFAISKRQIRRRVLEQAGWNQKELEARILELWKSDEIRATIRDYVAERL